jgi:hypothetical protein
MAKQEYETLKKQLEDAEKTMSNLYQKVEDAKTRMMAEELSKIEDFIPTYRKKLERLKKFMDGFIEEYGQRVNIVYAFKKVDTYLDDFHEPMPDPLEFKIAEYNLIGMSDHMDIIFDYSNEGVKQFVHTWMKENADYVEFTEYPDEMFGFKH